MKNEPISINHPGQNERENLVDLIKDVAPGTSLYKYYRVALGKEMAR